MEIWKAAKFLLLNDSNDYEEYLNIIHVMRKFKNYWKIDYSKLEISNLKDIWMKLNYCRSGLIALTYRHGEEFKCNTIVLDTELKRVNNEYDRRNRTTKKKISRDDIRRELAKKNRSSNKSKNR